MILAPRTVASKFALDHPHFNRLPSGKVRNNRYLAGRFYASLHVDLARLQRSVYGHSSIRLL